MMSGNRKTREEIEAIVESIIDFTGGDIALTKVIEKEVSNRVLSTKKEGGDKKRYIRQEELNWTCYYLLEGFTYEESLLKAAEDVRQEHEELQKACSTEHKLEYLNNMYDSATEENSTGFRKIKESGYLKKSDYKGKTRPRTGLKNIERAVSHKEHHEFLQKEVDMLKTQVEQTQASSLIISTEVEDINSLLGLGLTEEEKIRILLQHNYKPSVICNIVGCNKFKVSRTKRKLKGETT